MGCHTWFHKKYIFSKEEAKLKLIEIVDERIKSTERFMYSPTEEDKEFLSDYPEYKDDDLMGELEELNKFKDNIENLSDDEIFESFAEKSLQNLTYIKDNGLYKSDNSLPHDLFRKYGYPDDVLLSLEETLSYMFDPKNKCQIFEYSKKDIIEYWNKYPDGMIDFG